MLQREQLVVHLLFFFLVATRSAIAEDFHAPEPLDFDLVRPLGARQGQIEVNTLVVLQPDEALEWAPEVEWVVVDGIAIELELPHDEQELSAIKGAFQLTFPKPLSWLGHGFQGIVQHEIADEQVALTGLDLVGVRLNDWSFLFMTGARVTRFGASGGKLQVLCNPSLFLDLSATWTLGVESNGEWNLDGGSHVKVLPQVHVGLSEGFRVQMGGGAVWIDGELGWMAAMRLVLEGFGSSAL